VFEDVSEVTTGGGVGGFSVGVLELYGGVGNVVGLGMSGA
jgi:hypothetical protein